MTLPCFFRLLSGATILAAFIVSLRYCFRKHNSSYLRLFPFYHFLRLIVEGLLLIFLIKGSAPAGIDLFVPGNLFTFLELLFFSFIVFKQIDHSTFIISYLIITGLCASTIFFLYFFSSGLPGDAGSGSLIILNIYLIGVCLIYFMDLFSIPQPTLSRSPSFWITVGVFFYSVFVTPMLILYTRRNALPPLTYLIISGAGYTTLHLSFIKAYVCKLPRSSSLK